MNAVRGTLRREPREDAVGVRADADTQHSSPVSFAQARRIASTVSALPPQRIALAQAIGAVLAEPLQAKLDIPHTATSAMDGWAISGSGFSRWRLRSDGAESPGELLEPLRPGEAVAVLTGSPIPKGTSSVLRQEHGRITSAVDPASASEPSSEPTSIHEPVPSQQPEQPHRALRTDPQPVLTVSGRTPDLTPGRNIRPQAAEAHSGDILMQPAVELTPVRAAAAAVAGYDHLLVRPAPKVALACTGAEVITSGLPAAGEVRDVFGLTLPKMLEALGAQSGMTAQRLPDNTAELVHWIQAQQADLLITTGGTANSRADMLRPALHQLQAQILVDAVDMRPGHPTMLARLPRGQYLLGLPGNPLAGFVALSVLAAPLLEGLRGLSVTERDHGRLYCAAVDIAPARSGTRLVPVRIQEAEPAAQVVPVDYDSPHMMRGVAQADGIGVVPESGITRGESIRCWDIPG